MSFVNIPGATGSNYTLVTADLTAQIRVVVTATNTAGSASANAAGVGPVTAAPDPPSNSAPPVISGSPVVGQTLTTTTGTWVGALSLAAQWKKDGVNISGATTVNYTLVTGDVGGIITVTVTATNTGGSTSATSTGVGPVTSGGGGTTTGWHPLLIGNGGLLTGVDVAPDGTKVVRTDSYGAYVWDDPSDKWFPILSQTVMSTGTWDGTLGDGVEEIVIDPQNSNTIWMLWTGYLYKSIDKGRTMTVTDMPYQSYPRINNADIRTKGPFMAVDPKNSNIVYASTTARGIYRTTNGTNFTQMTNFAGGLPCQTFFRPPRSSGTDGSTIAVGLGDKPFNLNSVAFPFAVGDYVKVWRTTDPMVQMFGTVKTISGTTFTLTVDTAFGSGSFSNWTVGIRYQQNGGMSGVCGGHRIVFVPDGQTVTAFGQTVSKNLFIHTYGVNTWKSTDGGVSWAPVGTTGTFISGETYTTTPHASIRRWAADRWGVLWVVGDTYSDYACAYRYDDTLSPPWMQVPTNLGVSSYDAVAVDPFNSATKATTTVVFISDAVFYMTYTLDGGANWSQYGHVSNRLMTTPANDVKWFQSQFDIDPTASVPVCDIRFEPTVAGKVWVSGEGCYYFTHSRVSAMPITITQQTRGVEEFIPAQVNIPSANNVWMTAWDYPIFHSTNPAVFPTKIEGYLGSGQTVLTIGYSFDWQPGGLMCAVVSDSSGFTLKSAAEGTGYSTDGGVTWHKFTPVPHAAMLDQSGVTPGGSIAMADADTYVYVHTHNDMVPKETTNGRSATVTWNTINIPGGTPLFGWGMYTFYVPEARLIESDKTNGDIYLYNVNRAGSFGTGDAIYKRTKSTGLWSLKQSNPQIQSANFTGKIKHVLGQTGHMFFSSGINGTNPFVFTNDGWTSLFTVNANFTQVGTFAIGAAYPGQSYPAILALGIYAGVYGYYLCKDFNPATRAGTWVLQTYPQGPLTAPKDIGGDPATPGLFVAFTTGGALWSNFP